MCSTVGGYHEYRGGVQYRGGYHDKCGGYLEYRGGVQYCGGYHEYRGGYLEYRGGCSVLWGDIMMHVGDIMSTVEGVQYCGGESLLLFEYPTVLNTPHGTHDIPHMHHDIPHMHHDIPPHAS